MNKHRDLKNKVKAIYGVPSTYKGIVSLMSNWIVLITLMIIIVYSSRLIFPFNVLCYFFLSFLVGCALRGLDNLTHDASHYNLFSSKKLHNNLECIICFPVMKTLEGYRVSHMKHHRNYRKNLDDDPDTLQLRRWGLENFENKKKKHKIFKFYFLRQVTLFYFIDNLKHSFIPHFFSKKSIKSRLIFWFLLFSIITISSSWYSFLLGYLIPYFFWLPYIRFIAESAEHTNVELSKEYSNSRNNIGIFHRFFLHPHNDGYHQLHHLIASIPGYNLKNAHNYLIKHANIQNDLIESKSPIETANQIFN
ncbi:fatty acid desaturase [Dokdonia pacifica]|uniref:Fatty acid desaturase n=1 Tax=Dokdonia pacifica TaxID=1627892 RepID=A0A239CEN6_9FLAO|nr:fatty acid desaturase [Dokdonia pacifica]SNS18695.1 Fatty acid desaturase [Dokdonia pacifica]